MKPREAARRALLRGVRLGRRNAVPGRASGDLQPPSVPADWHVAPPDFVGVGAAGAATGWWHAQIERHPHVHRAPGAPNEVHFFDRFWSEPFTAADRDRYAQWFPRPEGGTAGEWTSSYLTDFWVPEMLAEAAPDARLLVLLRDPIERYAAGRARAQTSTATPWDDRDALGAFQRGLYAEPLRRLFAAVQRDRVLILQEEACRAALEQELARTLAFIGVPPTDLAPSMAPPPEAPARAATLPASVRLGLVEAYATDLQALARLAPELDLDLWPAARGRSNAST